MMGQFEQLDQMLTEQEGMLRTSQVVSSGISKPVFYDYVRSRDLDRVAHGIYLSKDSWVDAMYLLHLRFEQAVFSHETALFFHDLTDREPIEYTVTVKTGCNPSKMKAEGIQVFTIKADLHDVGLTTAKTPFGHTVPVYDMWHTARQATLRNSGRNMRKKFCSTRLLRMPLMRWASRSCLRSKSCRQSTQNCWKKRKRPMLSIGVPVRKCGSF